MSCADRLVYYVIMKKNILWICVCVHLDCCLFVCCCCRCALALGYLRVYVHRSAGDGFLADVAGSLVFQERDALP